MKDDIFDINTATRDDVTRVINGMLNAKNEWLAQVKQREHELGFA